MSYVESDRYGGALAPVFRFAFAFASFLWSASIEMSVTMAINPNITTISPLATHTAGCT